MRLTEPCIDIRPRPAWEAIDLGVALARRHRRLLMLSWALVTLPILGALSLLLWDYPGAVMVLFWWLKPLYERLPLMILSRALFGAPPSLRQALRAWPATLRSQLLPSLLWRRLSLLRSFTLPVQQLEGLAGEQRRRRLGVLCQADTLAARCLTLAGAHLEMVLYSAAILLIYTFVPRQLDVDWNWLLLLGSDEQLLWVDHLLNLLYALALIVWEPIYVSCGFMLYLNRRTRLEAWDIELAFKRLRQRLSSAAGALLICTALLLGAVPAHSWAATTTPEAPPQSPRLLHQPLTSQQSSQAIAQVLGKPPFKNPETVTDWRIKKEPGQTPSGSASGGSAWLDWMNNLLKGSSAVASVFEALLWVLAFGLLVVLAWRYRQWLRLFAAPQDKAQSQPTPQPTQLFGLQIDPHSLPDDVIASVQSLWASHPRDALSLLYRALLSRLVSDYRLPLSSADTEGDALQRIASLDDPALNEFSRQLTLHWQNLAYGHQAPPAQVLQHLCNSWQRLFEGARS